MNENSNKCIYVSPILPQPTPTSSDYTRLVKNLQNLNFNTEENSSSSHQKWISMATNHKITQSPSQSPSSSSEEPIDFAKSLEFGLKDLKILINGHNLHQESSSSADELYETASDNSNNSHENEENDTGQLKSEEYEAHSPKIRRCSSLKSGKTPPGTPGSKKIVRFADALGLDLADVKTFIDEIPKIPTSAYYDLKSIGNENDTENEAENLNFRSRNSVISTKTLLILFDQPCARPDFFEVVKTNYVCLENALVEDQISFLIKGIVRVRNIDFHKSVFIRYSIDKWKTFVDVKAAYVENSCDGFSDKFMFIIYANVLNVGEILEFAVLFQARGEQFWDNNRGLNYCFQCLPLNPRSREEDLAVAILADEFNAAFY